MVFACRPDFFINFSGASFFCLCNWVNDAYTALRIYIGAGVKLWMFLLILLASSLSHLFFSSSFHFAGNDSGDKECQKCVACRKSQAYCISFKNKICVASGWAMRVCVGCAAGCGVCAKDIRYVIHVHERKKKHEKLFFISNGCLTSCLRRSAFPRFHFGPKPWVLVAKTSLGAGDGDGNFWKSKTLLDSPYAT